MNFNELHLHENLMKGIEKAGYITCTAVQEKVLTGAFEGADLYVQSQTGTGKTAAYLITIIQQMLNCEKGKEKKALVMVPTRELAVQVEEEAHKLISGTDLKAASFYGGVGYARQTSVLKKGVDICIGTPGRVIDLQKSGIMDLSTVGFLVVDEADRMFDMGFYPDLRTLIKVLPKTEARQTMLFSATLNTYVKNLAWEYTDNAQEITIEADNITVDEIDQSLLHVSSNDKIKLLLGILRTEKPESVLIFCNTKRSCEIVAKRLRINDIQAEFIIGDLPQSKRLQVLESFKTGSLTCLVATDVAARGIDVNDLAMVVNFDVPNEAENYVHRIGRTARAGKTGKAYTFCSEQDVYNLPVIERYLGFSVPSSVAFEDMFSQDKSEGMYIRTAVYRDDKPSSFSKRDNRPRSSFAGSRKRKDKTDRTSNASNGENERYTGKKKKYKSGTGTYDSRDTRGSAHSGVYGSTKTGESGKTFAKSYTGGKSGKTQSFSGMERLSFEERMKLYREKYGSSSNTQTQSGSTKRGKQKKRREERFYVQQKRSNSAQAPSQQRKGLFAAIKRFFGKK